MVELTRGFSKMCSCLLEGRRGYCTLYLERASELSDVSGAIDMG